MATDAHILTHMNCDTVVEFASYEVPEKKYSSAAGASFVSVSLIKCWVEKQIFNTQHSIEEYY